MKVSKDKAAANKEAILAAASRLYREKGIDGIGIGELSRSVGLTHGGFYGQFPGGKEQLATEAVSRTFETNINDWRAAKSIPQLLKGYLTMSHLRNWTEGCPIPALGADVARTGGTVSHSFTAGVQTLIDTLTALADGETPEEKHQQALRILSSITGAILIARAIDDPQLAEQFLQSVINAWPDAAKD
ncbi:TetR/AcrR family transcriptional regulator [Pseudomonas vancouverensis]|uniref:TetR/AcrR family transcriptional regulator n=1 Tax=Pseudomonas vancouverensis TaxID=95300 RepID=A0A1H2NSS9_PSEVA|nr:helix-turn-helix domain-containing protein [Pseudomonas vancouverensis]KAB0491101.1 TetR/AcrR family transcriptional regulator [Pseudomonas vancouverensis]TDB59687.1 TetR/AcrR family transcriptional regulator [Pseudomonas vancouverensis]SDV08483.1 transcriptional regulator, TetR family [Pseudomonas vancouverensis]